MEEKTGHAVLWQGREGLKAEDGTADIVTASLEGWGHQGR